MIIKRTVIEEARIAAWEALRKADAEGELYLFLAKLTEQRADREPTKREIEWFRAEITKIATRLDAPLH